MFLHSDGLGLLRVFQIDQLIIFFNQFLSLKWPELESSKQFIFFIAGLCAKIFKWIIRITTFKQGLSRLAISILWWSLVRQCWLLNYLVKVFKFLIIFLIDLVEELLSHNGCSSHELRLEFLRSITFLFITFGARSSRQDVIFFINGLNVINILFVVSR